MNTKSKNLLMVSLITATLGLTAQAFAKHSHGPDEVEAVKVMASVDKGVKVVIRDNGESHKYQFNHDELENLENIEAQIGDMNSETRQKVMQLLSQVAEHEDNFVVIKDAELTFGEDTTEVFVIKSGDGENKVHIEIDAEGQGVDRPFIFKEFFHHDDGDHKNFHRSMKMKDGKHLAKVIKRMIKKADLSQEEIEEIRALLDQK